MAAISGKLYSLLLVVAMCYCAAAQTNYCNTALCYGFTGHIGCNNTGAFASTCGSDARLVNITDSFRNEIIRKHNFYRNKIASGFAPFKPAARMAPTRWNSELAKLAEYNVKRCNAKHDACRNTAAFKYAGQNIAISYYTTWNFNTTEVALGQIDKWFNEYTRANMSTIYRYKTPTDGTSIGSFTGMIQERGTNMGCAILVQTGPLGKKQQILTCNYSYINIEERQVYTVGPAASQCTTGTHLNFASLCKIAEVYNNINVINGIGPDPATQ